MVVVRGKAYFSDKHNQLCTFLKISVLARVTIAPTKHDGQKQLREEKVYFRLQLSSLSITEGSQDKNSQEPRAKN